MSSRYDLLSFHHHSDGKGLGELPDEAQFEVSDGEEDGGHDGQSQVVLPETPGGVIHTLLLQKLLPCTPAHRQGQSPTGLVDTLEIIS